VHGRKGKRKHEQRQPGGKTGGRRREKAWSGGGYPSQRRKIGERKPETSTLLEDEKTTGQKGRRRPRLLETKAEN